MQNCGMGVAWIICEEMIAPFKKHINEKASLNKQKKIRMFLAKNWNKMGPAVWHSTQSSCTLIPGSRYTIVSFCLTSLAAEHMFE